MLAIQWVADRGSFRVCQAVSTSEIAERGQRYLTPLLRTDFLS